MIHSFSDSFLSPPPLFLGVSSVNDYKVRKIPTLVNHSLHLMPFGKITQAPTHSIQRLMQKSFHNIPFRGILGLYGNNLRSLAGAGVQFADVSDLAANSVFSRPSCASQGPGLALRRQLVWISINVGGKKSRYWSWFCLSPGFVLVLNTLLFMLER